MGVKNKCDIEDVRKRLEDLGCECLTNEYKNRLTVIEFICKKHADKGVQSRKYRDISKNNIACKYCGRERMGAAHQTSEEELKTITENRGFIYIRSYVKDYKSMIVYRCKNDESHGEFECSISKMKCKKDGKCPICRGYGKTHEMFVKQVALIDDSIQIISKYSSTNEKVKCRCKKCNRRWETFPQKLLSGCGCDKCKREDARFSFLQEQGKATISKLTEMHPNIEFLSEYNGLKNEIKCRCKKCNSTFSARADALLKVAEDNACPKCRTQHYMEDKVIKTLEDWDYTVTRQKKFEDCTYISELRFDGYIEGFNTCIEYDGQGHYKPIQWGNMSKEEAEKELEKNKARDKIKDDYCKEKGIKLIRIPYWKSEHMEEYLFDELVKNGVIEEITTAS